MLVSLKFVNLPKQKLLLFHVTFACFLFFFPSSSSGQVAEVFPFGVCSAYSGIFSPISDSAAVLSLLCAERSGAVERCLRRTAVEGNIPIDEGFSFPDTVSRILNEADDPKEGCLVTPGKHACFL